jgi:hypothetical protein
MGDVMGRLEGKVAIVTEAAKRRGEPDAKLFAHKGAGVCRPMRLGSAGDVACAVLYLSPGETRLLKGQSL